MGGIGAGSRPRAVLMRSSGGLKVKTAPGGTLEVTNTDPPMTAPRPITVSPPGIMALA